MRQLKEYIFVFLISFEFLFVSLAVLLGMYWQQPLKNLGSIFETSPDILKYLALVPIGLAIWNAKESRKLLFPDNDKKNIIHEWPEYWKLKVRFIVSIIYSCLFAFVGISSWIMGFSTENPLHLSIILFAILGALSVSISVYWARINEEEALRKFKKH